MRALAIIPARSGSKGLPDKNIIEVQGIPLMGYSIRAAVESGIFDEIMVSTDSEKYATIGKQQGASVPFLRSEKMSSDTAGSWDMVREVLINYQTLGKEFDYVMLLQPTSPLRNSADIQNVFKMIECSEIKNVVSVSEVEHPVQWTFELPESCSMEEYAKSPYNRMRRQDLRKHYQENGAIYMVSANDILNPMYDLYRDKCFAYIMPRERSIDIDTRIDLVVLNAILSQS